MAIKSGGPRRPGKPPSTPRAERSKRARPKSVADDFARSREPLVAPPPRPRTGAPAGVLSQSVLALSDQVDRLEREAARLLEAFAASGGLNEARRRYTDRLDKIRADLDGTRRRLNRARRSLLESEKFPAEDERDLEAELKDLESRSEGYESALAAIAFVSDLAPEAGRRVRPRADTDALDELAAESPTTVLADLVSDDAPAGVGRVRRLLGRS